MPLSDLFKRSSKKEPKKTPQKQSTDASQRSPEMQKKRYNAAMEFVTALQEKVPLVGGKPHAGTVLAVVSRLAGSSLYRALNKDKNLTPSAVVGSERVNVTWQQLMDQFAFYCKKNSVDIMSRPMITQLPEQNKPRMTVEQVLAEYQDQYYEIMKKHGLDYLNGARAGMIICSIVFEYHSKKAKDIDPFVAAGIVSMGVVEGAKTAPPPLKAVGTNTSPAPSQGVASQNNQFAEVIRSIATNSTDGSGNRLVLGDGMMSMQDALVNGGRYILVHPEVASQLKQKNIDPYLVYETAMRIEIGSKIPRIDFVGGKVDEMLQTWGRKPQEQAPVHIRQVLWLNTNASGLGYEKNGNSWILKR